MISKFSKNLKNFSFQKNQKLKKKIQKFKINQIKIPVNSLSVKNVKQ
jgi:hypothetical protein